jgi:hypothetical protein
MPGTEEQLGTPIPDRHDYFIPVPQWLQRSLADSRKAEVPDLDDSSAIDEDIRGFEVPMDDTVGVEVCCSDEELVEEGFERWYGDVDSEGLVVMVDDLLEKDDQSRSCEIVKDEPIDHALRIRKPYRLISPRV